MSCAYSPLCDSSYEAYVAYLRAEVAKSFGYGSSLELLGGDDGSTGVGAGGDGGGDIVGGVACVGSRGRVPAGVLQTVLAAIGDSSCVYGTVCDSVGDSEFRGKESVSCVSGGVSSGLIGGLAVGCGDVSDAETELQSGSLLGTRSGDVVSGGVVDDCGLEREVSSGKTEKQKKNDERRRKNKQRKLKKKAMSQAPVVDAGEHGGEIGSSPAPVWRRGAVPVSTGSGDLGSKKGFFSDLSTEQRVELQASRAALLVKQNKLAAARAERELEVLEATDIEAEKRRQSTKLRAAIERNMVSIERTHAKLVATDNVGRDELDHDVHTVVTDSVPSLSSGSISPNSSASMAEYRAVQKQLLDNEKKLSDKEVENEKLYAVLKKIGIEPGVMDYLDKDMWTINSQGTLDDEAKVALEVLAPEGYVIPGQAYVSKGDKVTIRAL